MADRVVGRLCLELEEESEAARLAHTGLCLGYSCWRSAPHALAAYTRTASARIRSLIDQLHDAAATHTPGGNRKRKEVPLMQLERSALAAQQDAWWSMFCR